MQGLTKALFEGLIKDHSLSLEGSLRDIYICVCIYI